MESTNYSRNQCTLVIRVDGEEIEFPINFGLTADEIKELYPFIIEYTNRKILNPAVQFTKDIKKDAYANLSDDEYYDELKKAEYLARYWYGKHEESLLAVALRYALDIHIHGFSKLVAEDLSMANLADIKASDITDEEVETISKQLGLTSEFDNDFDPGDEKDVPVGAGGNLSFSLYSEDDTEADYLSDDLDRIESKLDVKDKFKEVIDKDVDEIDADKYKTQYEAGKFKDDEVKDGLFTVYSDEKSSVFDDDEDIDDDEDAEDIEPLEEDTDDESDIEDDEYVDEEDIESVEEDEDEDEPDEAPEEDIDALLDSDDYDYDRDDDYDDEDELINGKKSED